MRGVLLSNPYPYGGSRYLVRHRYPCTHGVAYYRLYEEQSLRHILEEKVSELYKYRSLQGLYRQTIMPVVLDELQYDGETKPPPVKKSSGRPKVKRYRRRSQYIDPSESIVRCSTCGQKGHNRRTCGRQKRPPNEVKSTEEQSTQKKQKSELTVNPPVLLETFFGAMMVAR